MVREEKWLETSQKCVCGSSEERLKSHQQHSRLSPWEDTKDSSAYNFASSAPPILDKDTLSMARTATQESVSQFLCELEDSSYLVECQFNSKRYYKLWYSISHARESLFLKTENKS